MRRTSIQVLEQIQSKHKNKKSLANYERFIREISPFIKNLNPKREESRFQEAVTLIKKQLRYSTQEILGIFNKQFIQFHGIQTDALVLNKKKQAFEELEIVNSPEFQSINNLLQTETTPAAKGNVQQPLVRKLSTPQQSKLQSFLESKSYSKIKETLRQLNRLYKKLDQIDMAHTTQLIVTIRNLAAEAICPPVQVLVSYLISSAQCLQLVSKMQLSEAYAYFSKKSKHLAFNSEGSTKANKVLIPIIDAFIKARLWTAMATAQMLIRAQVDNQNYKILETIIKLRIQSFTLSSEPETFTLNTLFLSTKCMESLLRNSQILSALEIIQICEKECLPQLQSNPVLYKKWAKKIQEFKSVAHSFAIQQALVQAEPAATKPQKSKSQIQARSLSLKHRSYSKSKLETKQIEQSVKENTFSNKNAPQKLNVIRETEPRVKFFSTSCTKPRYLQDKNDQSHKWKFQTTGIKPPPKKLFLDATKPFYNNIKKVKAPKSIHNVYEELRKKKESKICSKVLTDELNQQNNYYNIDQINQDLQNEDSNNGGTPISIVKDLKETPTNPTHPYRRQESIHFVPKNNFVQLPDCSAPQHEDSPEQKANLPQDPNCFRFVIHQNQRYQIVQVRVVSNKNLKFIIQGPDYRLSKKLFRNKDDQPKQRLTEWPFVRILIKKWFKRQKSLSEIEKHFAFLDLDMNSNHVRRKLGLRNITKDQLAEIVEVKETVKLFLKFTLTSLRKENGACKVWHKRFSFQGLRTLQQLAPLTRISSVPITDTSIRQRISSILTSTSQDKFLAQYLLRRQTDLYLIQVFYNPTHIESQLRIANSAESMNYYLQLPVLPLIIKCKPFMGTHDEQFRLQPLRLNCKSLSSKLSARQVCRLVLMQFCYGYRIVSQLKYLISQISQCVTLRFQNSLKLIVDQQLDKKLKESGRFEYLNNRFSRRNYNGLTSMSLEGQSSIYTVVALDIFDEIKKIKDEQTRCDVNISLVAFKHRGYASSLSNMRELRFKSIYDESYQFQFLRKPRKKILLPWTAFSLFKQRDLIRRKDTELNFETLSGLNQVSIYQVKGLAEFENRYFNLSVTVIRTKSGEHNGRNNHKTQSLIKSRKNLSKQKKSGAQNNQRILIQYQISSKINNSRTYKLVLDSANVDSIFFKNKELSPKDPMEKIGLAALSLQKFLKIVRYSPYRRLCLTYDETPAKTSKSTLFLHNDSPRNTGSHTDLLRISDMKEDGNFRMVLTSRIIRLCGRFFVVTISSGPSQKDKRYFSVQLYHPFSQELWVSRMCYFCIMFNVNPQLQKARNTLSDPTIAENRKCMKPTFEDQLSCWSRILDQSRLGVTYDSLISMNYLRVYSYMAPLEQIIHQETTQVEEKKSLIEIILQRKGRKFLDEIDLPNGDNPVDMAVIDILSVSIPQIVEFSVKVRITRQDCRIFSCSISQEFVVNSIKNQIATWPRLKNLKSGNQARLRLGNNSLYINTLGVINEVSLTTRMISKHVVGKIGSLIFQEEKIKESFPQMEGQEDLSCIQGEYHEDDDSLVQKHYFVFNISCK